MICIYVYLALLALCLVNVEGSLKKFGCLITPNICTPPEDCSDDGLFGNCQVPDPTDWNTYQDAPYMKIIRDLRNLGEAIDYKAIEEALKIRKYYRRKYLEKVENDQLYIDVQHLFDLLAEMDVQQSARKNNENLFKDREMNNEQDYDTGTHPEFRRSAEKDEQNNPGESGKRRGKLKSLVKNAVGYLEKHDVRISDLSKSKLDELTKILAKMYMRDNDAEDRNEDEHDVKNTSNDQTKTRPVHTGREFPSQYLVSEDAESVKDEIEPDAAKPVELEEETNAESEHIIIPKVQDNSVYAVSEPAHPEKKSDKNRTLYLVIIVVGATVLLIIVVTILTCCIQAYWEKERQKLKGDMAASTVTPMDNDYQELCRQHYASKNSEHAINQRDVVLESPVKEPLITRAYHLQKPVYPDSANHEGASKSDQSSLNTQTATRNSSVSSTSWSEEPVTASLDITTGHAVLSYMEDHLHNKDRLEKEWEDICNYEADRTKATVATNAQNARKNRAGAALPYDHNRVKLNQDKNQLQNDYINASLIIDNDPKRPLYIAAQGPLPSTIPDFWQMMWEQGCVAIVMLTPLVEEGVNQCARYWPDEGSCTYHKFEIHLVSEHIWCEDYLVRSLYLKNLETGDTRTVTQFHFLSWPNGHIPTTPKPLLELRRKVTKCYKGHNSPVLVHCSDGVGRTGTYILLDLAIDRMLKGAKEIDIAATLEHIRDQRSGMVGTKEQFEFALTAVAEEVNAILKSLLH